MLQAVKPKREQPLALTKPRHPKPSGKSPKKKIWQVYQSRSATSLAFTWFLPVEKIQPIATLEEKKGEG
jgi:hypothetical protein